MEDPAGSHPAAIITQSATIFDGVVYVGVSSLEEAIAAFVPGYICCSFRGSMAALDLATGRILWKTYLTPSAGYPGNAVWGSSPAIDTKRRSVYIAHREQLQRPRPVLDVHRRGRRRSRCRAACLPADNYFDSILSLDMRTGAIKWATSALPFDAWTVACIFDENRPNCPEPAGPDYDFGQAPALFKATNGRASCSAPARRADSTGRSNPDTGAVVWVTNTGPGGTAGGLQWGSAVDGKRIYTANANSDLKP